MAIQDTILNAIEIIADSKIANLETDKTITATIVSCVNALTGLYKLKYNGGFINAFADDGRSYSENQTVYVLIPQGDISKKKMIVGGALAVDKSYNLSTTASLLESYTKIGNNVIKDSRGIFKKGLNSYKVDDGAILYLHDRGDYNGNLLDIDNVEFANNLKKCKQIMIQGTFSTRLPREHRLSTTGTYGIRFNLAFKNQNDTDSKFCSLLPEYQNLVDTLKETLQFNETQYQPSQESVEQANGLAYNQFKRDIISVKEIYDFFPAGLTKRAEIEQRLDESLVEQVPKIKLYTYELNTTDMVGNPYNFISETSQYNIYPIDVDNFLYVDSITFFSTGFETVENEVKIMENKEDIFLHDLQLYALGELTGVSGDYSMNVSMPKGTTFRSVKQEEQLNVVCSVKYKQTNITEKAVFYWFKKDNRVKVGDSGYLAYGGTGWRYLGTKGADYEIITTGAENKAYENTYKVLCMYQNSVTLLQEFTIYNEACKRDIEIVSNLGTSFSFDRGTPQLTCRINKKESDFDDQHEDKLFSFVWSKVEPQVSTVVYSETYAAIEAKYKDLTINVLERQNYKRQMAQLESVKFYDAKTNEYTYSASTNCNKLQYSVSGITSSATFTCDVYLKDSPEEEEYSIGSASITLTNENAVIPAAYNIVIENGAQVFQYSEMGVTPTSEEKTENPVTIKPLIAHFYDPTGLEVNSKTYTVKWKVPLEDSMIYIGDLKKNLQKDEATELVNIYYGQQFPLAIYDNYDYSCLNNQVQCIVEYHDQMYYQNSDLTFTKVGENGTNGTDITALLVPTDTNPISPVKLGDEPLTIITDVIEYADSKNNQYKNSRWNSGQNIDDPVVQLKLYQRNEDVSNLLQSEPTEWAIAGSHSSILTCEASNADKDKCVVKYDPISFRLEKSSTRKNRNQILKGIGRITKVEESSIEQPDANLNGTEEEQSKLHTSAVEKTKQYYYAYLPIPSIEFHYPVKLDKDDSNFDLNANYTPSLKISIDKTKTMRTVLYDEAGRNPHYDKNQGVNVRLRLDALLGESVTGKLSDRYVYWETIGGMNDYNPGTSLLSLSDERDSKRNTKFSSVYPSTQIEVPEGQDYVDLFKYVHPADDFSGAYNNNAVHIIIYRDKAAANAYKAEAEIFIPIYCSLNTHALASLNAWDGTSVDVNEEGGYILAPQIGAGEKTWEKKATVIQDYNPADDASGSNYTNVFTGVLMGVRNTYDGMKDGLSTNKQSTTKDIGLFGYSKGRQSILLDAQSGQAIFGLPENRSTKENKFTEGQVKLVPGGISSIANWKIGSRSLYNVVRTNDLYSDDSAPDISNRPYSDITQYQITDKDTNKYSVSIPSQDSGILLSALPAYMSIKGAELVRTPGKKSLIEFDSANAQVHPGDSFELQLDPNQASLFSIYVHSSSPKEYTKYDIITDTKDKRTFYIINKASGDKYTTIKRGNSDVLTFKFHEKVDNFDDDGAFYISAHLDTKVLVPDENLTPVTVTIYPDIAFSFASPTQYYNKDGQPYNADGEIVDDNVVIEKVERVSKNGVETAQVWQYKMIETEKWTIRKVQPNALTAMLNEYNRNNNTQLTLAQFLEKKTFTEKEISLNLDWRRWQKVGIDDKGRFFTNALKDGQAATYLGSLPGFGKTSDEQSYYGAQFEIGSEARNTDSLIKFFVDRGELENNVSRCNLYISGSSQINNEYNRSVKMYFKDFELNASRNSSISKNTQYQVALNNDKFYAGHKHLDSNGKYVPSSSSWIEFNNNVKSNNIALNSTIFSGVTPLVLDSYDNDMSQNSKTYHQKVIAPTANATTSKYLDDHTLTNISYETKIKGNKALVLDGNNTIFISGNYDFTKTKGSGGNFDKKFVITDNRITLGDNFDTDSNVDKYYGIGNEKKNKSNVNVSCFDMGSKRVSKFELSNDTSGKPSRLLSNNGLVIHTHDTFKDNGMYFKLDSGNFKIDNQAPNATAQSLKTTLILANPGANKWVQTSNSKYLTGAYLSTGFGDGTASIELRQGDGVRHNPINTKPQECVGVLIHPGLRTGWGEFDTTIGGAGWEAYTSIYSARDIRINNGWLYADDIRFNNFGWDNDWNVNNGEHTLSYIIHKANDKMNSIDGKVNWHWNSGDSWSNNQIRARADDAYNYADRANANANNRVDWGTYNSRVSSVDSKIDDIWSSLKGASFVVAINQAGSALAAAYDADDWAGAKNNILTAGRWLENCKL